MRIEFSKGMQGHIEVESILRIAHRLRETAESLQLRADLEHRALTHLQGDDRELARMRELLALDRPSWLARSAVVWHRFWGPSDREMELSKQRSDALERAERAEHSSFEALADMARVGRERDAANAELEKLRWRVGELENEFEK